MFSTKDSLCVGAVLLTFTCIQAQIGIFSSTVGTPSVENLKGNCSCGGFPTLFPPVNSEPLLAQAPGLVVNCDDEGSATCKDLCFALATTAKAKGPEILCTRLKDAMDLRLAAFYKICDKPWLYAGMTADVLLCCEESKVKTCSSATNATGV